MTLNREIITRSVFDRLALSRTAFARSVETTFEIIKKTLEAGEDVLISAFGKICVKDKRKRRGGNPQTKDALMLAERRIVSVKCSTVVKSRLNGGGVRFGWPRGSSAGSGSGIINESWQKSAAYLFRFFLKDRYSHTMVYTAVSQIP